jgi:NodT family efflux transporter outer membrane factor (OMF) lipoprotein
MKNKIVAYVILCWLYVGCKPLKTAQNNKVKKIPESYKSTVDSINSANINWKNYFSDPILIALIEEAITDNLDLLTALQKIEITRASFQQSKGGMLPTISAGISSSLRRFGLYTMDGAGNISTYITEGQIVPINLPDYYLGANASWEVDVWGKLRNKKKAALARYLSSVEGKNFVITNLVAETAATYYELLALDNELEIIRETIILQEDALALINIQKQTAVVNELAVQQFLAQTLNSKGLEFKTLQKITECENKINFLMGRFPQTILRDKSQLVTKLPFQINIGIPSDLLANRPDIRRAEYDLMAAKADVKAAKAAFYPSLNITGAMGMQAFKTEFLFTAPESMAYTLLGSLMAPVVNRNAIKKEFKQANAIQQEALYNYQKSIINGYIEVYNEAARIKNLEKIVELKSQEANTLSQSIQTASELFRTGRATYVEVLMAQKGSLQSRLELVNTMQQQYLAVINIYKALGGGWK